MRCMRCIVENLVAVFRTNLGRGGFLSTPRQGWEEVNVTETFLLVRLILHHHTLSYTKIKPCLISAPQIIKLL